MYCTNTGLNAFKCYTQNLLDYYEIAFGYICRIYMHLADKPSPMFQGSMTQHLLSPVDIIITLYLGQEK